MATLLSIGEFARLTHLSVKALRHYDDLGLVVPTHVDPTTGYRSYAAAQVPTAQLIRRLRDLEMPLDEVGAVLAAGDVAARDRALVAHLQRMEERLAATERRVGSLRALLEGRLPDASVEYRVLPATSVFCAAAVVDWDDAERWLDEARESLEADLLRAGVASGGPFGAVYPPEFFTAHRGEISAFVPLPRNSSVSTTARAELPEMRAAVMVHAGSFADLDTTYGALGTHVAERMIGLDGPVREHYLDELRVEVCWPIADVAVS
jgi:DNA-binding transcriptional MerR regulator